MGRGRQGGAGQGGLPPIPLDWFVACASLALWRPPLHRDGLLPCCRPARPATLSGLGLGSLRLAPPPAAWLAAMEAAPLRTVPPRQSLFCSVPSLRWSRWSRWGAPGCRELSACEPVREALRPAGGLADADTSVGEADARNAGLLLGSASWTSTT